MIIDWTPVVMSNVSTEPNSNSAEPCPICDGSGEIVYVDDEVGCHVVQPCWRCAGDPSTPRDAEG